MTDRSLEQMMLNEYERVTSGVSAAAKPTALLGLVRPASSASVELRSGPTIPKTPMTQSSSLSPAGTFSTVAQTLFSSTINKSYTVPATASSNPPAVPSNGGSVAGDVGKTGLKVFTGGLGLMPLISGLAGLFGSGEATAPAPLLKYAMPRSIQLTAANSKDAGSLRFADYAQDGTARSYGGTAAGKPIRGTASTDGFAAPAGQSQGADAAPQIVVNVQAMDSRSFMDHSQEIAQAVREAMLNMSALNDVVSEL